MWVFRHVDYIPAAATSHLLASTQDGDRYRFAVAAVDKRGNTLATDIDDVSWVEIEELPAG
ncbi:hypothetical protein ACFUAG_05035 [Streptomyces sp. NPDC057193]|uniref:hypothetical protein n=1 Tax=Streptomyces sp. NPDC057193 TaxID=3346043 RepID=UPI003636AC04